MGIAEALRVLNDFYAREVYGEPEPNPNEALTTKCKCGHQMTAHKHDRKSKRHHEPCTHAGCHCCNFRPMTIAEKAQWLADQPPHYLDRLAR